METGIHSYSALLDGLQTDRCDASVRHDVRSALLIPDGASVRLFRLDPERLQSLLEALPQGLAGRNALQRALHFCDGAGLYKEAVEFLRDGLKQRAWGIVCPSCESIGAPKWTTQTGRSHDGCMQCTHTSADVMMSVTHAAWKLIDQRIQLVDRPVYDASERERVGGKFA